MGHRFKKPHRWQVQNKRLFQAMKKYDISPNELAEIMDVTIRSVQKWIYIYAIPRLSKRKILVDILFPDVPEGDCKSCIGSHPKCYLYSNFKYAKVSYCEYYNKKPTTK